MNVDAHDGGALEGARAMGFRTSVTAISLVAFLGLPLALCAQQAKTPTLDEILQRLEANLNHYDTALPSLFCDEHVVSQVEPSARNKKTVTDSNFRLKRTESPDHTTTLVESREIKRVDGKPAASQDMKGPSRVSGAFEGGLAVVSLSQRTCMKYRLERVHGDHPTEPYIVSFATALTSENKADCLLQEKSSGRVVIDPASMEIKHLEMMTPRHVIIPGNLYASPVIGKWVVTVDYAPVLLDGDTFWMPSTITSRDTGKDGFSVTVWTFEATYRNYHRLEVKSRILPGGEGVVK
jgi:hypothetical protein